MTRTRHLSKRVSAIEMSLRAANPRAFRIAALSAQERHIYDEWQTQMDLWMADRPDGAGYAAIINDEEPPQLHEVIRRKVFGKRFTQLTISMTLDEIQHAYQCFAQNAEGDWI